MSILIEGQKPIKAELLGNLLSELIQERINYELFNELSLIILCSSIPALYALPSFFESNEKRSYLSRDNIKQEPLLFSLGICSRHGNMFRINETGKALYVHCFKGEVIA